MQCSAIACAALPRERMQWWRALHRALSIASEAQLFSAALPTVPRLRGQVSSRLSLCHVTWAVCRVVWCGRAVQRFVEVDFVRVKLFEMDNMRGEVLQSAAVAAVLGKHADTLNTLFTRYASTTATDGAQLHVNAYPSLPPPSPPPSPSPPLRAHSVRAKPKSRLPIASLTVVRAMRRCRRE